MPSSLAYVSLSLFPKLILRWKIENLIDALTFIRFDKRMYKQFNFLNALHALQPTNHDVDDLHRVKWDDKYLWSLRVKGNLRK